MNKLKPDGKINCMTTEANELNNTISELAESMSKQIAKAQTNILLSDIIMIYETEITYDEYQKLVAEHNELAYKNNKQFPDGKSCSITLSYMPQRTLLYKDEFDFIKELKEKYGL